MLKCFISTQKISKDVHSQLNLQDAPVGIWLDTYKNRVLLLWYIRAVMIFCALHIFDIEFLIKWLVKRSKVKIFNNRYTKLKDSDWGIKTSRQSHYFVVFCCILKMFGQTDSEGPKQLISGVKQALQSRLLFCGGIRTLLTEFSATGKVCLMTMWQKCSVLAL